MSEIIKTAVIGRNESGKTTLISLITKIYGEYIPPEDLSIVKTSDSFLKYNYIETEVNIKDKKYIFYEFAVEDYIKCAMQAGIEFNAIVLLIPMTEGVEESAKKLMKMIDSQGVYTYAIFATKVDLIDDEDILDFVEFEYGDECLRSKNIMVVPQKRFKASLNKAMNDDEEEINTVKELIDYIEEETSTCVERNEENTNHFIAQIYNLPEEFGGVGKPIDNSHKFEFVFENEETTGTITLIEREEQPIMPSNYRDVNVLIDKKIDLKAFSTSFILKEDDQVLGLGLINTLLMSC